MVLAADDLEATFEVTECLDASRKVRDWSSFTIAMTAYVLKGVCIEVYTEPGCRGHSKQLLSNSIIDEMDFRLELSETKSFSPCRKRCPNSTRCFSTEFQCPDGACIKNDWKCDGKLDCLEGEDEQNCGINSAGNLVSGEENSNSNDSWGVVLLIFGGLLITSLVALGAFLVSRYYQGIRHGNKEEGFNFVEV